MKVIKKVGNSPIARNLARILGEPNLIDNLRLIEEKTGIAQTSVRNWISGYRKPQLASLEKIADLFNIDVYSLFDEPSTLLQEQKEIIELVSRIQNKGALDAIKRMVEVLSTNQEAASARKEEP
ncbi:MAG: helix-turn-helix transcriptional regulator [bacterium]